MILGPKKSGPLIFIQSISLNPREYTPARTSCRRVCAKLSATWRDDGSMIKKKVNKIETLQYELHLAQFPAIATSACRSISLFHQPPPPLVRQLVRPDPKLKLFRFSRSARSVTPRLYLLNFIFVCRRGFSSIFTAYTFNWNIFNCLFWTYLE